MAGLLDLVTDIAGHLDLAGLLALRGAVEALITERQVEDLGGMGRAENDQWLWAIRLPALA